MEAVEPEIMPLGDAEGAGLDEGGGGLEFLLEILARQALGLADVDLSRIRNSIKPKPRSNLGEKKKRAEGGRKRRGLGWWRRAWYLVLVLVRRGGVIYRYDSCQYELHVPRPQRCGCGAAATAGAATAAASVAAGADDVIIEVVVGEGGLVVAGGMVWSMTTTSDDVRGEENFGGPLNLSLGGVRGEGSDGEVSGRNFR